MTMKKIVLMNLGHLVVEVTVAKAADQEVGGVIHHVGRRRRHHHHQHQVLQDLPMIGPHHLAPVVAEVVLLVPNRLAHLDVDLLPMMMMNLKRIILPIRTDKEGGLNDLLIHQAIIKAVKTTQVAVIVPTNHQRERVFLNTRHLKQI
jgi:hypothetical protein